MKVTAIESHYVHPQRAAVGAFRAGAFLPGDKPAVLHLQDPELFAAQLKILKNLVSKQDAPRDVQNVQVVAFC